MHNEKVLEACKAGIQAWQEAFNRGDAAGCAEQYTEGCPMSATPFGDHVGREAIQAFWQKIIDDGFNSVEYSNVKWQALGDDGYVLSAEWQMNRAYGLIHHEHWQVQADGKARLVRDEFEILGER